MMRRRRKRILRVCMHEHVLMRKSEKGLRWEILTMECCGLEIENGLQSISMAFRSGTVAMSKLGV